jgi:uncharacterized membrane protein YjjP (DUF1212 family)
MAAYIPLMYFLMVLAWIILLIGYLMKDFAITAGAGIFMSVIGVFVLNLGLDGARTTLTVAIGLIYLLIGLYVFIRGGIDLATKYWGG